MQFPRFVRLFPPNRNNGSARALTSRLPRAFCTSLTVTERKPRVYRYAIDVHGQLFLHDTTPKNLTSCFKNPDFLNFFMARVKPIEIPATNHTDDFGEDWPDTPDLSLDEALRIGRVQGYHWISPCQGEHNLIRAADSPVVFRELTDDGMLLWAGTFACPFEPSKLKIDEATGYLYHPSPVSPLGSVQRKVHENSANNPFGLYSLMSSALVLDKLASDLRLDPEHFCQKNGGSIVWHGQTFEIGLLEEDDVPRDRRYRVDDLA